MDKINTDQITSLLILLVFPLAYLVEVQVLTDLLLNNTWIIILASIIPGYFLYYMYGQIIIKNSNPFPELLNDNFGMIIGKAIALLYSFFFFLTCGYTVRVFVEFTKSNLLIHTPISVMILVFMFLGYVGNKNSITNLARLCHIVIAIVVPFFIIITLISLIQSFRLDNLQPFLYDLNWSDILVAFFCICGILGKGMVVFIFVNFIDFPVKLKIRSSLYKLLIIFILTQSIHVFTITSSIGVPLLNILSSPTLSLIRYTHIGDFVQNIEIFFVAFWIIGVFYSLSIFWFAGNFSLKLTFKLSDYRILSATTALLIALISILISPNNLGIYIWSSKIMPVLNGLFFIIIPLVLFVFSWFKPNPIQSYNSIHKSSNN